MPKYLVIVESKDGIPENLQIISSSEDCYDSLMEYKKQQKTKGQNIYLCQVLEEDST